jgi:hypothetical protein
MPTLYWCPHQVLKTTGAPELAETIVRQKSATINNYFNQSQTDKSVQGAEINKT